MRGVIGRVVRVLRGGAAVDIDHALAAAAFDRAFYLATYPDVATSDFDPLTHFMTLGWREGRDPSPTFYTDAYLAAFAILHVMELVTLDRDFRNFEKDGLKLRLLTEC